MTDNWENRNRKQQLHEENARLRKQLGIEREGPHNLDDFSPEMENEYLRQVEAYHEMEKSLKITIRSFFSDDFDFPPADQLTDAELKNKLDAIETILSEKDIFLDLIGDCPHRVVYQYVVDEVLQEETALFRAEGMQYHIDGCDGCCPECFQLSYCQTGKEILNDESGIT